ncbi:MAG TPA: SCO family protein [Stellaceae bacterium]|nr:SCO family protein [Stellaceae bacterium]
MIAKSRALLVAALAASAIVLGTAAALFAINRPPAQNAAPPLFGGHFALSTADGRSVSDQSYRGKWLLVYFGYTYCPDACPTALTAISSALERLGPLADKFQPLFITVDPQRDTPEVLTAYIKSFDPRIIPLVGTPEQIAAAAKAYHVYYAVRNFGGGAYAIDHSSFIYIVDPNGRFARLLTGDVPGHQLADELRRLLT